MRLKIKWISICFGIILITTCITSLIPSSGAGFALSQVIGFISGVYCMSSYLEEVENE